MSRTTIGPATAKQDVHAELILNGRPWTVMWQMAWPAVAVMMLWGLNAVMDAVYIGQLLGPQALAGAVLGYPLTQLTLGLSSLAGIGGGVVLSIAIGRGDREMMRCLPGTVLCIAVILSAFYALLGGLFAEPLVRGMGARGELVPLAADYLRASAFGGVGAIAGMSLNMLLRGEGKMKLAAGFMAVGLLTNIVLTPIFILVFDLGVAGAAWATNVGGGVGAWLVWRRFRLGQASYPVNPTYFGLHRALRKRIIKSGFPAMVMSAMGLVQSLVVFNVLTRVGDEGDVAFFGAAWRILLFMLTPLFGLMRAFQPVAGINYGAHQMARVRVCYWTFVKAGTLFILPVWLLMTLSPETTLALMLPSQDWSAGDLRLFRVLMVVLPVLPIVFTALALLPAIEQPGKATTVSVSRQLLLYVPVMLIVPSLIGVPGIYYGSTAIDLLCAVWLLWLVRSSFARLEARSAGSPGV